jgi:hypothetical protein
MVELRTFFDATQIQRYKNNAILANSKI